MLIIIRSFLPRQIEFPWIDQVGDIELSNLKYESLKVEYFFLLKCCKHGGRRNFNTKSERVFGITGEDVVENLAEVVLEDFGIELVKLVVMFDTVGD
jgi:hypothetical protein